MYMNTFRDFLNKHQNRIFNSTHKLSCIRPLYITSPTYSKVKSQLIRVGTRNTFTNRMKSIRKINQIKSEKGKTSLFMLFFIVGQPFSIFINALWRKKGIKIYKVDNQVPLKGHSPNKERNKPS